MFNSKIFSKNCCDLRNAYYLSTTELSCILNLKRHTSIVNIENNKSYPSFELLVDICSLFAVSLDWLMGFISEPYNEEFIEKLENEIAEVIIFGENPFILNTPKIYRNVESRRKYFSLDERANIIFLVHYIQYLIKQNEKLSSKNVVLSYIENFEKKNVRIKNYENKYHTALAGLGKILIDPMREYDRFGIGFKFDAEPLFDIRKKKE